MIENLKYEFEDIESVEQLEDFDNEYVYDIEVDDDSHTFIEWVMNSLENNQRITGYTNMYTSSIDTTTFSAILYELLIKHESGLWNSAADGVMSKYELILQLAKKCNEVGLVSKGLLPQNTIQRGDSLGLSINKLKKYYPNVFVPTVTQVIDNIYTEYMEMRNEL